MVQKIYIIITLSIAKSPGKMPRTYDNYRIRRRRVGAHPRIGGRIRGPGTPSRYRGRSQSGSGSARSSRSRSRGSSRTRTSSRTKTAKVRPDGPISESSFSHKLKFPRQLTKHERNMFSPNFYSTNQSYRLTTGLGLQNAYGLIKWNSVSDINQMFTVINNNYNVVNTSTSNIQGQLTQKLYLKDLRGDIMITNQTNDVAQVYIYDVIARRDMPGSGAYTDPWTAWQQGSADSAATSGGTNAYEIIGTTPFQTAGFTEWYKVLKITDINIHSGGHHKHQFKLKSKRFINQEVLNEITASGVVGQFQLFTMILVHGFPLNDLDTLSEITTANIALDIVWKKQYEYYVIQQQRNLQTYVNNMNSSLADGPAIINDLTGLAATIVQA